MAIPTYEECMLPLMKIAEDGEEHLFKEAIDILINQFNLTDKEKQELLPSGSAFVINNRIGWARTYLTKAGLLLKTRRGHFRISEEGKKFLQKNPECINTKMLKEYDSFNEFQATKETNNNESTQTSHNIEQSITPHELLESGYLSIKNELADELLSTIKNISPSKFEKLVVDLLVKMGYGGSIKEAATVVGKSGDEGIDGIIKEDKLGLDVIYIQAKKWDEGTVGRPEIQKFAGALLGKKAKKGIFITTSTFTNEAKKYVTDIDAKIILLDGKQLTELMIENDLGVSTQDIYTIKRIDSDYFEES
ncbi:restriction endonuclease [Treponema vincentii]|uniref:Restriction endonuclease n=1 Tax=Treponema vincentii ATCC 35580 TaxID=596324 RepID=C8PQ02_9SPIR|nr:restriction endonuclease [Treponema vincentii]EEV20484.1 restriction endonuclease [Treponema vincentii ATCC 35580]UTC46947.1 restriction endonuclease [Treponema vincentii]UTC59768.1 restriction endonuclease [Treponema vincentii]